MVVSKYLTTNTQYKQNKQKYALLVRMSVSLWQFSNLANGSASNGKIVNIFSTWKKVFIWHYNSCNIHKENNPDPHIACANIVYCLTENILDLNTHNTAACSSKLWDFLRFILLEKQNHYYKCRILDSHTKKT